MTQHSGFQIVRRHTHAQEAAIVERDLGSAITSILPILSPIGGASSTATSSPAASSTPTTTSQTPKSSSGGSSESGSSNDGGNTGSSTSSGSTTSASSGNGSNSNSGSGDTNSGASNSGTSDTGGSVAGSQAPAAAGGGVAGASSAAAATPAAGSTATAAIAASATQAALSAAGLSSTALMTEISTAANGSVFTTILPIGGIPTANPFGKIANSTAVNSISGVSGINSQPTGTAADQDQDHSSGSSNAVRIAVPVAVVLGVLALGLLVVFLIRRQRKSMERDLQKPLMLSKNKNGLSTITAGAGAFGFTAAGIFKRGRRGSGYGQSSSHGHGAPGLDHRSWLAGRPMSEEGMYADNAAYAQEYNAYNNQGNQRESYGSQGQHQTEEMNDEELSAAAAAAGQGSRHHDNNPYSSNDQAYSRQSITSGEGGYLTASEEGADPFSNSNRSRDHFDGSASYGYSNPAARGLDAAAVQGATGGQMLSPYPELRRNSGNDNRKSITNTTQWNDGADMGEDFAPVTAESQAQYSPNRIMQHPQLNSSRWSG